MTGGHAARWKDEDKADVLTGKAVDFITRNTNRPFFLYFATHDPHVPRVPHPRFVGKSGCGARGDVIVEFDWCVGKILSTLDQLRLASNTIVIVSSDNGPVVDDGYDDRAPEDLHGHRPAGPLRGGKYSVYEGGTRVPFILSWPGRVTPGVGDAPDSVNVLPALLGQSPVGRSKLVEHDGSRMFGFRDGPWKWIEPDPIAKPAYSSSGELYDLGPDLGETNNLRFTHPDRSAALSGALKGERAAGGLK